MDVTPPPGEVASRSLRAGRAVMLVLIILFGLDAVIDLIADIGRLSDGDLDSPLGAALGFAGVALAWWVWVLYRRLALRDRLARTQAIAVHSVAAGLWGLPLLILVGGLVTGSDVVVTGSDDWTALGRDIAIVLANLFVVTCLAVTKDCDRELSVPAPAAALSTSTAFAVDSAGRLRPGEVAIASPPPSARNWILAPTVVRVASIGFVLLAALHMAALMLSFRSCEDCETGQILGTITAVVLSPLIVIASAGSILVAIGVVRRWKAARSLGTLLSGVFMITAPVIDQLIFGGIESSFRGGARASWNGEIAFLVAAANICLMILLTRPAARGWELSRERVVAVTAGTGVETTALRPPVAHHDLDPEARRRREARRERRRQRHEADRSTGSNH